MATFYFSLSYPTFSERAAPHTVAHITRHSVTLKFPFSRALPLPPLASLLPIKTDERGGTGAESNLCL